ncbi:MAG: hypothetical protein OIF57_04170 [Marinobacterium sp.]|nr:hypothetical protein [Marinobacterium sp.]
MADFNSMRLTAAGYRLRAAAEIGQTLQITRIGLGAGDAPDDISGLTALVDERQSAEVETFEARDDGTGLIRFYLSNAELARGYPFKEIGVYALDPDTGEELLIDYTNAGSHYDTIPAGGGSTVVEQVIDLITIISPTDNITAQLTSHRGLPPGGNPGDVLTISVHNTMSWAPAKGGGTDDLVALLALTTADVKNKTRALQQESRLSPLDQALYLVLNAD